VTDRALRFALAGNPNVGKTSLFNVLTGSRHQVGNYAGVTVERREGLISESLSGARRIRLLDLPGTYSLSAISEDEAVAFRVVAGEGEPAPDGVLLVVDATNLARNLYLVLQLRELGVPIVVALNMMDVARAHGLSVDPARLQKLLGVPVVPTTARSGAGAKDVVRALLGIEPASALNLSPSGEDRELADALRKLGAVASPARARWLLTGGAAGTAEAFGATADELAALAKLSSADLSRATEQLVALRYREVDRVLAELDPRADLRAESRTLARSERIDSVLTHRVWGMAIFAAVMATVFVSIFTWAAPLMDAIEGFVSAIGNGVALSLGPGLLGDLLQNGVIAGAGNVLVFVPQIALLFLFIGLLEDSGYLARAAFLMDRIMARLGLHGRAFIPLLSGYACAIPAILGTRTISNTKDRMVTILMIPFMSCSARLPIYSLVIGALFVTASDDWRGGVTRGLVLLGMYALSTGSALFMGWLYKRTILKSPTPPLVLELPPYRLPRLRNTLLVVADRTMDFVRNAGTVILACTIVLWALLSFPREDTGAGGEGPTNIAESWGGRAARAIEPALTPIGQDWRMGVGIIGSFAAREVLVSTLGLVYGMEADDDDPKELREAIRNDEDPATGKRRYTPLTGLALMVFFVYACQCMSTLAVVRRETRSWKWTAFMFASMTGIAYVMALLVYQGGRLLGFE
jgi:ferrous iron transport protein B